MNEDKIIALHGVKFPRCYLAQHLGIFGNSGSGKTNGIIKVLLRQLLGQGDAAVIFDVKGDLLDITKEALSRCGRRQDLVTLGVGENDLTFNPLANPALSAHEIATQLVTSLSMTGQSAQQRSRNDELFWEQWRNELLTVMVELARAVTVADQTPLTFTHLQRLRPFFSQAESKLERWAKEAGQLLSEHSAATLLEFSALADSTRGCVVGSALTMLAQYARSPISDFVIPTSSRPALNLPDILNQSKVLVVTGAQAEHAQNLWPAFLWFKQALYQMILSRTRLPVRQDNQLLVVIDEYNRLMLGADSPMSEHVVMEAARSNKTNFILAAQNLSGLEIAGGGSVVVDKLTALTSNLCFLSNSCTVTARLAGTVLGKRKTFDKHRTITNQPPPPLFFPPKHRPRTTYSNTVLVPVEKPVLSAEQMARLKPGHGYLKLVDGSVHKIKCTFD